MSTCQTLHGIIIIIIIIDKIFQEGHFLPALDTHTQPPSLETGALFFFFFFFPLRSDVQCQHNIPTLDHTSINTQHNGIKYCGASHSKKTLRITDCFEWQ